MAVAVPGELPSRVVAGAWAVSSRWNGMFSRHLRHPGRLLAGVGAAAVLLLAGGWIESARPGRPGASNSSWSAGFPRAIVVHDGRATFRVPTPGPTSETLVIVSVLTRSSGPYPLQLRARPVGEVSATTTLTADGPPAAPRLN